MSDDKGAECTAGDVEPARSDAEQKQTRDQCTDEICEKKRTKPQRKVCFPDDDHIVTQYFEPANPWQDVTPVSRAQLAAEYLELCHHHNTIPFDCVLQQIRDLPESCIGGSSRAPRLTISDNALHGCRPADALEAVFRRAQFTRLEIQAPMDDEAAEALFDMVEYYESATAIVVSGPRHFGIRGWQAASRMVKKSCHLQELEISNYALEPSHAPVLSRALHAHSCRLRTLCLQQAMLSGEALLALVIALKSNNSVRELRLGDNQLTAADAAQIASLLRFNTRLQLLDLSNNQIQDAGAGLIADALAAQAKMTSPTSTASPLSPLHAPVSNYESRGLAFLVLWNNQLTRNCAHHLSKALLSQSLCVLNVGRNAVGADAIRALSGGALVSLGLQCARLGPDCARALQELVTATTTLQRLDLRDNKLGSAGLQAILTALKQNNTLTQIDLDEPHESATLSADANESATIARLTRDIRARCRSNEPNASPERKVHRKISLTCYSAAHIVPKPTPTAEESRGRLRSPLPSPAGSPIPAATGSRFSVTRVTPERETPAVATPTRTTHSPSSRFKVVHVAEPPTIHIHTPEPTIKSNRFSVTRNYDSSYNVTPVPSPPPSLPNSGTNPTSELGTSGTSSEFGTFDFDPTIGATPPRIKDTGLGNEESPTVGIERTEDSEVKQTKLAKSDNCNEKTAKNIADIKLSDVVCKLDEINVNNSENAIVHTVNIGENVNRDLVKGVVNTDVNTQKNDNYHNKTEEISHNTEVDTIGNKKVVKTETKLITNTVDVSETEKRDVQVQVTVKTETMDVDEINKSARVHNYSSTEFQNIDDLNIENKNIVIDSKQYSQHEKRDNTAMKQIEAITEDLGHLIDEMKELSTKTASLTRKDSKLKCEKIPPQIHIKTSHVDDVFDKNTNIVRENVNVVLKKNKSESSLDSPDLEVSRLMNKKVTSPFHDSSSSLEISGSSMESLNTLDQINISSNIRPNIKIVPKPSQESDSELDRRKLDQIVLSTETSIDSNPSEATPVNTGNFLNMSVSSNESVSPIIFSAKKIHGSLSSLEASVSSLESTRHERTMVTSADSGIEYSIQNPAEKDDESNEGTLTESNLKENVRKDTFLQDTLTSSPKRTSSLLDVPALKNKGLDRMRKISWVAPSSSFQVPKPEPEKETKLPSHLEKLLSLFQHPTSLFSRSPQNEEEKKCNTPPRKDSSLTSSFWSWGSSSDKEKEEIADTAPLVTEERPTVTNSSSIVTETKTEYSSGDTQTKTEVTVQRLETVTSSAKVTQYQAEDETLRHDVTLLSSILTQLNLEPSKSQDTQISTEVTDLSSKITQSTETHSKDVSEMSQATFSSQENDSSPTDSTLSERAQIAFIDESFSKKLESKTSSTDTENTSEYQSAQISSDSVSQDKSNDTINQDVPKDVGSIRNFVVTDVSETTDISNTVQTLVLSCDSSNGNKPLEDPRACDITDLKPNDMNKNYEAIVTWGSKDNALIDNKREPEKVPSLDNIDCIKSDDKNAETEMNENKTSLERTADSLECDNTSLRLNKCISETNPQEFVQDTLDSKTDTVLLTKEVSEDIKELVRPRSFAAVLKTSGSENTLEKPTNPEGQPVDKIPIKIIQGIKENISPENTLTSSITNTLVLELDKVKNQPIVNTVWETTKPLHDKDYPVHEKSQSFFEEKPTFSKDVESIDREWRYKAPIATIDETCEDLPSQCSEDELQFIDDITFIDEKPTEERVALPNIDIQETKLEKMPSLDITRDEKTEVDLAKDALSYLIYENQDFDPEIETALSEVKTEESSLAQELQDAENKQKLIDLSPELVIDDTEVFNKNFPPHASPIIPDRAKLKKANSLENLVSEKDTISPKTKTIAFKIPETSPRDIPRRPKLRSRSGSSPKSLPESLNKCPLTKLECVKKKKKVSSLGKMAKDSLLALNMTEEEIAEFRRSHKLTSVESLRSLESVSEDANSPSGTSYDSRCRSCLRTSQESLMSLDSITEDCRCSESEKVEKLSRSAR